MAKTTEGGSSRREFLKVASTAAGAIMAGAVANEAQAQGAAKPAQTKPATTVKPTPSTSAAGGQVVAGGIPVPTVDAKQLTCTKYPKGTVMATGRAIGSNERIVVGFVGLGGQGTFGHLRGFVADGMSRNTKVNALCDAYDPYLERAKGIVVQGAEKGGDTNPFMTRDYRKLLERKDIDAVMIATPEHWHGQIAVHAMEAGKHVYCEKPMVRYVDEAFQVHDAAVRTKRVFQVGSQGCSDVKWHAAAKAIQEGRIGKMVMGQGSYCRNNPRGEWNYEIHADITQKNFDWELWLGSAPKRAWNFLGAAPDGQQGERDDTGARFRRYRKYWDYSGGILGDLMPHKLHPFLIASGNPEYPTRVTSIGTNGVHGPGTGHNDREVADTVQVLAEFPSGWSMLFVGSTVNEQGLPDLFRGDKGTIYFGNEVEYKPERPYSEEMEGGRVDKADPALAKYAPYENIPAHERNWLDCIRKGDVNTNGNIDLATKVQVIISLAEMSARLNRTMTFDAKTRKVG